MIILKIFIALAIPTLMGIIFVKYAETKKNLPACVLIPIGFGLGFGFLTQWMLFLSIIQVDYSRLTIGLPLLLIGFLFFIGGRLKNKSAESSTREYWQIDQNLTNLSKKLINASLTLYIIYIIFFVCLRGVMVPILEWDAISWIALKGKIFFHEKHLYQHPYLPNSAYPLHVSLSLTWIALNLGEWSETLVKIIFPAYFLAYSLLHYSISKIYLDKLWAKSSLALLLSANFFPYHATIAYRDITLMFYFCSSILLILLWNKTKNNSLLIVSALFLGFASFVKLEGAIYMGIGLLALIYTFFKGASLKSQQKWIYLCRLCLIPIVIFLFYHIYKILIGATEAPQNLYTTASSEKMLQSFHLFKIFINELFLSANWHLVWFLFVLSIFQFDKIKNSLEARILAGVTLLFLLTYFTLGSLTNLYIAFSEDFSSSVLPRLILHIYPLAVFFIALVNGNLKEQ